MKTLAHDINSSYRPDIDGLRAVAVLAVVFFHIDPALLPGGFAGVDIFFVISGFLITRNINKDFLSAQGFSWWEFYRRRSLRILPVMFFVLLVTLAVGHFILLPDDLEELSYSALASVFSVANVYFTYFLDTSYFADDSSLQPLLHLWSLGVEEQFYIFWPLILIVLLARFSYGNRLLITFLLALVSFILAELLLAKAAMFAYYMLPTRAGELLVGALLALWLSGQRATIPKWCFLLAGGCGAVLVAISLGWITEDMGFPGLNALPATLGAALLIWAGSTRVQGINRILSWRPLVLVGLISYSLYLWHWPILAFYRYVYGVVEPVAGIVLFGSMLVLSVISYRCVEKPCRQIRWNFSRVMVRVVAVNALAVSALCSAILLSGGLGLYSFDAQYQAQLKAMSPAPAAFSYPYVCQRPRLTDAELQNKSCIINSEHEPSVLLWGDSNAAHYVGMLGAFAEKSGFAFRNAAHSSCPPLLDGAAATQKADRLEGCLASIQVVSKHLKNYNTVILAAAWSSHAGRSDTFFDDLVATVNVLVGQGKDVIILGQTPNFRAINRKCSQKSLKVSVVSCSESTAERSPSVSQVNEKLYELAKNSSRVHYFDPRDSLCPKQVCSSYLDGQLVYFDAGHLSMDGSWSVGRHIISQKGVPEIFSQLKKEGFASSTVPLDEALLERGRAVLNVPVRKWESLLVGDFERRWRGNVSLQRLPQGMKLEDDSATVFSAYRYKFSPNELKEIRNTNFRLRFKMTLSSCEKSMPLLRVTANRGDVSSQFDVMLDCESSELRERGDNDSIISDLEFSNGKKIILSQYVLPSYFDYLEVSIYPSVGLVLGRYDARATGHLVIHDIAWGIAPVGD